MELDDSIRQSTNDLGHSLSDLVPPTLIKLTDTQKCDVDWVGKQVCNSAFRTLHAAPVTMLRMTREKSCGPPGSNTHLNSHCLTGFCGVTRCYVIM